MKKLTIEELRNEIENITANEDFLILMANEYGEIETVDNAFDVEQLVLSGWSVLSACLSADTNTEDLYVYYNHIVS